MNTYLVRRTTAGVTRVETVHARTPQAAARKVFGAKASIGVPRDSMAGAVRALEVSNPTAVGEVTWSNQPGIRLVRYAYRPDSDPFWTDPDQWTDSARHPLTVLP